MSDVTGRSQRSPPDPIAVVGRSWPFILVAALVVAGLGAMFANAQAPTYTATAVVVVEDARSQVLQRPSTDIERYVLSQAAVIRSEPVAGAASEALAEGGVELPAEELLDGLTVSVEDDSDVVSIRLRADDPATAQQGATAVARAYAELVRSSIRAELAGSRDRLDQEIESATGALTDARLQVAALRSDATAAVEDVVAAAAEAIAAVPDDDVTQTQAILDQLSARQALANYEERDPVLAGALRAQADLEFVVRELADRRAELTADISLVGSGVAFITDAGPGRASRFSTPAAVLLGAVLGGGLGLALAYLHATGKRPTEWSVEEVVRVSSSGDSAAGRSSASLRAARDQMRAVVSREPEPVSETTPDPPVLARATTDDRGAVMSIELAVLSVLVALEEDVFEVPPRPPMVTAIVTRDTPAVALELGRRLAHEMVFDGPVLLVEGARDAMGDAAREADASDSAARTLGRDGNDADVVDLSEVTDVDEVLAEVAFDSYDEVLAVLMLEGSDTATALRRLQPHKVVVVSLLGHEQDTNACWDEVSTTRAHRVGTVVVDNHAADTD